MDEGGAAGTTSVAVGVGADAVGTVTLDRPDRLNAMDGSIFTGLEHAAEVLRAEVDRGRCRAVLLRGAGRAFSSGLDVRVFAEGLDGEPIGEELITRLQESFTAFERLPVPVVASLKGPCLGGGLQLALVADVRLAGDDAQLGLLEARWGLVPDLGGTWRLPRVVGLGRAVDLAVRARTVDADTAERWGLVTEVHPAAEVDRAAAELAAGLADGPVAATGRAAALMRAAVERDREAALADERRAQLACLASPDFEEVVSAAMENRRPRFVDGG